MTTDTPRTDEFDISAPDTKGMGTWCEQYLRALQFARQLERELAAAQHDAERYRWLRDTMHGSVGAGIEVNDRALVYEEAVPGEEVRVYWYPNTPVGFNQVLAATLDAAIDAAREKP